MSDLRINEHTQFLIDTLQYLLDGSRINKDTEVWVQVNGDKYELDEVMTATILDNKGKQYNVVLLTTKDE